LYPDVYDHPVHDLKLIETHISWVVLTGEFAYKIKKPVNFGFLDFSTLQKRKLYCEQELQLNSRLTTGIYLDVVAISIQQNKLRINEGEAIEYAIQMAQFPQSAQLDNMLATRQLNGYHMEGIGCMVANFHQLAPIADESLNYGNPHILFQPVEENFTQINENLDKTDYDETLKQLKQWTESEFNKLTELFISRKKNGFIRECHGDMHLRNLLWLGDISKIEPDKGPMAFDCIEFNEQLRWIDVISEVAFLVMDLQERNQYALANKFLNSYLEVTGDYAGLSVLPFYLCYRAMVRAKVGLLRLKQQGISDTDYRQTIEEFETYLKLANSYSQNPAPKLIIMRGVSASGKSTLSEQLLESLRIIRIRSDVERKRLFNITPDTHTSSQIDSGLYSKQASRQTYAKIVELASQLLSAGFSVIIDAAFLKHAQRKLFQRLAEEIDIPYIILQITAPSEVLRQRITDRKNDVSDADLKILEHQLLNWQPLEQDEKEFAININSMEKLNTKELVDRIK